MNLKIPFHVVMLNLTKCEITVGTSQQFMHGYKLYHIMVFEGDSLGSLIP